MVVSSLSILWRKFSNTFGSQSSPSLLQKKGSSSNQHESLRFGKSITYDRLEPRGSTDLGIDIEVDDRNTKEEFEDFEAESFELRGHNEPYKVISKFPTAYVINNENGEPVTTIWDSSEPCSIDHLDHKNNNIVPINGNNSSLNGHFGHVPAGYEIIGGKSKVSHAQGYFTEGKPLNVMEGSEFYRNRCYNEPLSSSNINEGLRGGGSIPNCNNWLMSRSKNRKGRLMRTSLSGHFINSSKKYGPQYYTKLEGTESEEVIYENNFNFETGSFNDDDERIENLTCDVCERIFQTKGELRIHQKRKRHYGCLQCDSIFPCRQALLQHREQMDHYDFASSSSSEDEGDQWKTSEREAQNTFPEKLCANVNFLEDVKSGHQSEKQANEMCHCKDGCSTDRRFPSASSSCSSLSLRPGQNNEKALTPRSQSVFLEEELLFDEEDDREAEKIENFRRKLDKANLL